MIINIIYYFLSFLLGQAFTVWGQFYTLKYTTISTLEAFFLAIPFAWISWFFMTIAIGLGAQYNIVSPFQDKIILIIMQFILVTLLDVYWLKKKIHRSDIVTFFIIIIGFYISLTKFITKNFITKNIV